MKAFSMKTSYFAMYIFGVFFGIQIVTSAVLGAPEPDQLLIRHYRDTGQSLLTGQAVVLHHTYQPYLPVAKVLPPGAAAKIDEAKQKKYLSHLSDKFDVKLGDKAPAQSWKLYKVYYSGEKKRVDVARLTASEYDRALAGKLSIDKLSFTTSFDDGHKKMTSVHDVAGHGSIEATVMNFDLYAPDIQHFGRARCGPEAAAFMIKVLGSDQYTIAGASTHDGYLVTAVSSKASITRIEGLFDPEKDYRIKGMKTWYRFQLMTEEISSDYITTASGDSIPTKEVRRKFSPIPDTVPGDKPGTTVDRPMLSFEETFTVLSVDFNLAIPDSVLTPVFKTGTRVYDGTVVPPKNYIVGGGPKKAHRGSKVKKPPLEPTVSQTKKLVSLLVVLFILATIFVVVVVKRRKRSYRIPK